jgi:DNA-directed RNA polymerase sigma subunit (sigma70/sigma32)
MTRTPSHRIDLGLAILSTLPRRRRTLEEIAAFCGCHNTAISRIERKALKKLRIRLASALSPSRPPRP